MSIASESRYFSDIIRFKREYSIQREWVARFTLRKTANTTQQRMPDVCTNAITWRRRERQQARVKSCGFVWFVIMRIILHNNDMTVCLCIVYQTTRYTSHIAYIVFWRLCGNFSVLEFKAEWIWIPTTSLYTVHFNMTQIS